MVILDESGNFLQAEHYRTGLITKSIMVQRYFIFNWWAHGLDLSAIRSPSLTISLGRVTWPHLMIRGMIAEQLYRAQQILKNHPYHRD